MPFQWLYNPIIEITAKCIAIHLHLAINILISTDLILYQQHGNVIELLPSSFMHMSAQTVDEIKYIVLDHHCWSSLLTAHHATMHALVRLPMYREHLL